MRNTIRLARVMLSSAANGPGNRDVFWTAGCSIRCPGCINPEFLKATSGFEVPLDAVEEIMTRRRPNIEGVTFSGGEPTEQAFAVTRLATHARKLGLSVVIFSGHTIEEIQASVNAPILTNCDILIAGPFRQEERHTTSPLLGSANQKLHFLSGRYCVADLQDVPTIEIRVQPALVSITGVPI